MVMHGGFVIIGGDECVELPRYWLCTLLRPCQPSGCRSALVLLPCVRLLVLPPLHLDLSPHLLLPPPLLTFRTPSGQGHLRLGRPRILPLGGASMVVLEIHPP